MSITYYEQAKTFKLDTPGSSYVIGIFDDKEYLSHYYYGNRITDIDTAELIGPVYHVRPSVLEGQAGRIMDAIPFEYPAYGCGDYREHCLEIETAQGHHACGLRYRSHRIIKGKPVLEGLPATFASEEECNTLIIECCDEYSGIVAELSYSVFRDLDVITRSVKIINRSDKPVFLIRVLSAALDFSEMDYDVLTLHGSWEKECGPVRQALRQGRIVSESSRGESGPTDNPFMALLEKNAAEDHGEVFAMNFVYSGNFKAVCEGNHFGGTRMVMGINPLNFRWKLEPGECFTAPEVVLVHSSHGLGSMTRTFHDLYRRHLIRDVFPENEDRPVLVNSWEAAYFDFDSDRLLRLAEASLECGIELFVLDDGWFGSRNNERQALGDWIVNESKLPGGLAGLSKKINGKGMKFGLWIEPEMVSPDSDLFRCHPDWAIQIPGRPLSKFRYQYVLDWSRKEVRDYVYDMIREVLDSANVSYIKWDMNRTITEPGSSAIPADRQGELFHRYVLGVYDIMDRLRRDFPDILLENCSAGGSRFDPGVLYYSPQIWASDDSDAIERIQIQLGTGICYPLSSIGAHVSAVPNHRTGRTVPLETRGIVAMSGTFGFELDITKLSEEEKRMVSQLVDIYHEYHHLVRNGDLYRIGDPFGNRDYACWMLISKDGSEALLTYIQTHTFPGYFGAARKLRLKGLKSDSAYEVSEVLASRPIAIRKTHTENASEESRGALKKRVLYGDTLMNSGLWMKQVPGDYMSSMFYLKEVSLTEL